jgi:hypothetical protein
MQALTGTVLLLSVVGAFVAFGFAQYHLFRALRASQRGRGFWPTGWIAVFSWPALASRLPLDAIDHAKRFKLALLIFIALIFAGIAFAMLAGYAAGTLPTQGPSSP